MRTLAITKALADETRLRLLNILMHHEFNVNELVTMLKMGQSRISRHLKILSDCGLLCSRRDGLWVFYRASHENGNAQLAPLAQAISVLMAQEELFTADLLAADQLETERSLATTRFFNAIAPDLDQLMADVMGKFDLAEAVGKQVPQCNSIAELGCGTGGLLQTLATQASHVIGVDSSPEMLEQARARLDRKKLPASLRIGALEHLPLRNEEVDVVVTSLVLHHLADPRKGLVEAHRVLAPGGTLIVADFVSHTNETMRAEHGDRHLGFDPDTLSRWASSMKMTTPTTEIFSLEQGLSLFVMVMQKNNP